MDKKKLMITINIIQIKEKLGVIQIEFIYTVKIACINLSALIYKRTLLILTKSLLWSDLLIIAVDGPAGSGKSTVARKLAGRLGFNYLDTGAMYRAFTWKVIDSGVDFKDEEGLRELLNNTNIQLNSSSNGLEVFVDKINVAKEIRTAVVTKNVHIVSAIEFVREKMVRLQRDFAAGSDIVAEGRDIGTVVFPNAEKKFYLDADIRERAKRRYAELKPDNDGRGLDSVIEDLKQRDHKDTTRKLAPLRKVEDAFYLDTTNKEIDEVISILIREVEK